MIYLAQKIKNHKTIKAKHQNGDFEMAYEIDFIGVNSEKSTKDADAICMRWRSGVSFDGTATYKIGVVDGGFEARRIKVERERFRSLQVSSSDVFSPPSHGT